MGIFDQVLAKMKNTTAATKLDSVVGKIDDIKRKQVDRSDQLNAVRANVDAIRLDLAAGDPAAEATTERLNAEIDRIERAMAQASRVLSEMESERGVMADQVQNDVQAAIDTQRAKTVRAFVKTLPALLSEASGLSARLEEIRIQIIAAGGVCPPLRCDVNFDEVEKNAKEWLEYAALPVGAESPSARQSRLEYDADQAELAAARRRRENPVPLKIDLDAALAHATPAEQLQLARRRDADAGANGGRGLQIR